MTRYSAFILLLGLPACSFSANGGGTGGSGGGAGGRGGKDAGALGGSMVWDGSAFENSSGDANLSVDGPNCGVTSFGLERLPPDLLVVLDRSGTMKRLLSGHTESKWTEVSNAINQVVSQTEATIRWGLKLYAFGNLTSTYRCLVPDGATVPVDLDNAATIAGALTAYPAEDLSATPTHWAIEKGVAYLRELADGYPKYIMLATDGLPNCAGGADSENWGDADDSGAIQAVSAASAAGIPVFIVGIATAGSSADTTLNAMAVKGGHPRNDPKTKYFPVSTTSELVDVLTQIGGQVSNCTFHLSSPPPFPQYVAIDADATRVPNDTTHTDGWDYGAGLTSIELFGSYCAGVKNGSIKQVRAIFGCDEVPVP